MLFISRWSLQQFDRITIKGDRLALLVCEQKGGVKNVLGSSTVSDLLVGGAEVEMSVSLSFTAFLQLPEISRIKLRQ